MILNALKTAKPSREDVLAIIRDQHRHQCHCDPEADPDIELTFDSTVEDWRNACDLVDGERLAVALNEGWKVAIPLAEWEAVLTPPEERTLGDVCEFLTSHAEVEHVVPPTIFGRACASAGVFFAIRELLARDGADVTELCPSTPLSDYSSDFYRTIAGPISALAPGRLPPIDIDDDAWFRASCALGICCLGFFASILMVMWWPLVWVPFAIGVAVCWLWLWYVERDTRPPLVSFGNLQTIRDVCVTLAPGIRKKEGH